MAKKETTYAYKLGYNQCKSSDCPSSLINPFPDMEENMNHDDWIIGRDDAWEKHHSEAM